MSQHEFNRIHSLVGQAMPVGDGLFSGLLGLSLYYYCLYSLLDEADYADKSIELLEEVMNREEQSRGGLSGHSLANGTAGLGYLLSLYVAEGMVELDLDADFAEADEQLFLHALHQLKNEGSPDFLHGATGALHYFLTRSGEARIRQYLEELADAFAQLAIHTADGCWFPSFIADKKEQQFINTSLSHGNTGFLLVLLELIKSGIRVNELSLLVKNGIQFLLAQQVIPDPGKNQCSFFPSLIQREVELNRSGNQEGMTFTNRLAWCYGDLNMVLLLYKAAALLGEAQWKERADELGKELVQRKSEAATLVSDSHFCHGSAGLISYYESLYRYSGLAVYQEAAGYWLEKTRDYLKQELHQSYYKGKEGDLLEGLPGIALALLSSQYQKETAWNRLLLL
jgi:lantibiotic biosynthesis protein